MKRGETSGRLDDNSEVISKRIDTFFAQSLPLVSHFNDLNLLTEIDGSMTVDQVYVRTRAALNVY